MAGLDWLIARPVAHRGLHDAEKGVIENTSSAFAAAIAGGYGIECDLQVSADGDAMVHHDEMLGRLTDGNGRLDALTAAELKRVPFKITADRMITLAELCDLVDGRAPLLIELKSRFAGDRRLVGRAAKVLAGYGGPAALMSFDPAQIATLREIAPQVPRAWWRKALTRFAGASGRSPRPRTLSPCWCKAFTRVRNSSHIPSAICPPRCRRSRARFWVSRS
jgi:glycerophosphoryl diester phosphodiesterase